MNNAPSPSGGKGACAQRRHKSVLNNDFIHENASFNHHNNEHGIVCEGSGEGLIKTGGRDRGRGGDWDRDRGRAGAGVGRGQGRERDDEIAACFAFCAVR